jgi:hypothetical protein
MARKRMSREEFERRRNEMQESLRRFGDYVTRRTAELEEQRQVREQAERRRAERRRRFLPFLR